MSYAGLAAVFLLGAVSVAVATALAARLQRRWWATTALAGVVLVVLTAVFDSLMIAADLYRYDAAASAGLKLFLVPVEDFAWPLVAVLLMPALWELFGVLSRAGGRRGAG